MIKKVLGILAVVSLAVFIMVKTDFLNYSLTVINRMLNPEELIYEINPALHATSTLLPAASVLIGEVFLGSNSIAPFIELYNPGDSARDLTGSVIKRKSDSAPEATLVAAQRFENVSINPRGYLLIARASSTAKADVYWPKSYNLAKVNSTLYLYNASGEKIDEASWSSIPEGSSLTRIAWNENGFAVTSPPTPQGSISAE